MGQQQLLLIILGIIIVAVAIAVGINLFRANAIDQKRHNVMNDCINLAAMAQQYYLKPSEFAGGGNSFLNWSIPNELDTTANGFFKITGQSNTELTIVGTGNEVVTGQDSVKVQIIVPVPPNAYQVSIIN